jgi:hypothetical protein
LCIGEIGLSPHEFWSLTESETLAKVRGYYFTQAYMADNFRSLYTLTYNINVKKGQAKQKNQLWPLIIDNARRKELTHQQIVERNRRVREAAAQII